MKKHSIVFFLLITLTLTLCLSACQDSTVTSDTTKATASSSLVPQSTRPTQTTAPLTTEEAPITTPPAPSDALIPLMVNKTSDYTVIYPSAYIGNNIKGNAVEHVKELIKTNADSAMEVRSDLLMPGTSPARYEILLGPTNRPESIKAAATLRRDDYIIGFVDGKLVAIGGSDEASAKAIRHFAAMFFKYEQTDLVLRESFFRRFDGTYPLSSLTLFKTAIWEAEILCDTGNGQDARILQEGIAALTGYTLPIVTEKAANTFTIAVTGEDCPTACLADGITLSHPDPETRSYRVKALLAVLSRQTEDAVFDENDTLPQAPTEAFSLSLMDLNIYAGGYGENAIPDRYERLMVYLEKRSFPDILTLQDVSPTWIDQFSRSGETFSAMKDIYAYVGRGRNDDTDSVMQAIFYRKDKFTLVESDTFWLSETPTIASVGWDGRTRTVCTWAILKDRASGETFAVMNTRLDPYGTKARQNGVKLILEKAKSLAMPTVFAGDMQSEAKKAPVKSVLETFFFDAQALAASADQTPVATTNAALGTEEPFKTKSDFVFVSYGDFKVKTHTVDTTKINDRVLSNHYPILTDLTVLQYR